MSDETETEAPVVAPVPSDPFAGVGVLLSLITNEKGCRSRLRELRTATAAAEKAQAELVVARTEHDALIAHELAEIAEQRNALETKAVKLAAAEGMLTHREQICDERQANLDCEAGALNRCRAVG